MTEVDGRGLWWLELPGVPVPKGRPRRGAGGRMFTPKRTRDYEQMVAWYARGSGLRFAVPVELELVVRLSVMRGDGDNYLKSVVDGLVKGGLLEDDGPTRVVAQSVRLERCARGAEGVVVFVREAVEGA